MIEISVVIPVYRSAGTLPKLVTRLHHVLRQMGVLFEIILVNDGSPDSSWQTIGDLARLHPFVSGINLMRNYGQHAALAAGIRMCQGSIIVSMDDDLQTPPEELPKLISKLSGEFDLVYGVRAREAHGLIRNSFSRLGKNILSRVFGVPVATSLSSYKAFRRCVRSSIICHQGPVVFIDALLCWSTTRVGTVVVEHHIRSEGRSGYNWRKLLRHYANMTTSFSQLPLKVASFLGLATMGLGLALFVYVLTSYLLRGTPVPGFTFVAASVTLFSGIQLLMLGIMGEYLARMHQSLLGMPAYVVREVTGPASFSPEFAELNHEA